MQCFGDCASLSSVTMAIFRERADGKEQGITHPSGRVWPREAFRFISPFITNLGPGVATIDLGNIALNYCGILWMIIGISITTLGEMHARCKSWWPRVYGGDVASVTCCGCILLLDWVVTFGLDPVSGMTKVCVMGTTSGLVGSTKVSVCDLRAVCGLEKVKVIWLPSVKCFSV